MPLKSTCPYNPSYLCSSDEAILKLEAAVMQEGGTGLEERGRSPPSQCPMDQMMSGCTEDKQRSSMYHPSLLKKRLTSVQVCQVGSMPFPGISGPMLEASGLALTMSQANRRQPFKQSCQAWQNGSGDVKWQHTFQQQQQQLFSMQRYP